MPQATKRILTWTLALIGAVGFGALLVQWMQLSPFEFTSTRGIPDVALSNTELVQFDESGAKVWTVFADHVDFDETRQNTVAQQVEVVIFLKNDQPASQEARFHVRAEQMHFNHFSKDLVFDNGLQATTPQGLTFRTESAIWSDTQQSLTGEGAVFVEQADALGGKATLQGQGFRYDSVNGRFVIHGDSEGEHNAQLVINPEQSAP